MWENPSSVLVFSDMHTHFCEKSLLCINSSPGDSLSNVNETLRKTITWSHSNVCGVVVKRFLTTTRTVAFKRPTNFMNRSNDLVCITFPIDNMWSKKFFPRLKACHSKTLFKMAKGSARGESFRGREHKMAAGCEAVFSFRRTWDH